MKKGLEWEFRKMIFFAKKDTSHFLQMKFHNFGKLYKRTPTYIIKDFEKGKILGKFYEKELRNVLIKGKSY